MKNLTDEEIEQLATTLKAKNVPPSTMVDLIKPFTDKSNDELNLLVNPPKVVVQPKPVVLPKL